MVVLGFVLCKQRSNKYLGTGPKEHEAVCTSRQWMLDVGVDTIYILQCCTNAVYMHGQLTHAFLQVDSSSVAIQWKTQSCLVFYVYSRFLLWFWYLLCNCNLTRNRKVSSTTKLLKELGKLTFSDGGWSYDSIEPCFIFLHKELTVYFLFLNGLFHPQGWGKGKYLGPGPKEHEAVCTSRQWMLDVGVDTIYILQCCTNAVYMHGQLTHAFLQVDSSSVAIQWKTQSCLVFYVYSRFLLWFWYLLCNCNLTRNRKVSSTTKLLKELGKLTFSDGGWSYDSIEPCFIFLHKELTVYF